MSGMELAYLVAIYLAMFAALSAVLAWARAKALETQWRKLRDLALIDIERCRQFSSEWRTNVLEMADAWERVGWHAEAARLRRQLLRH